MFTSNTLLEQRHRLGTMGEKSINHVFAENLKAAMDKRGVNQTALSEMSKVSQKTVSNYLNPNQRGVSATGKMPSAKLTELEMIADALDIEPWQLLRPLDPDQRAAYEAIETAFLALQPKSQSQPAAGKNLKVANGHNR